MSPPAREEIAVRPSELDSGRPVHLCGVAGSAMRGLAAMLRQRGFTVVGTDPRAAEVRELLEPLGVSVFAEQDGRRIRSGTQLLVATAAIPEDHPEIRAARRLGLPVVKYARMLGALMSESEGIAIAGTHGKTTTTALAVAALRAAGARPGFVLGGQSTQLGGGADAGDGSLLVAEACEYDRSFLELAPRRLVVTNIEADHLDVYGDFRGVLSAFEQFVSRLPADGTLVFPDGCPHARRIADRAGAGGVSFSVDAENERAEYRAGGIARSEEHTTFSLVIRGREAAKVRLRLPGRHNVSNALAALAVCCEAGFDPEPLAGGIGGFAGVERRFELRGEVAGVVVVDDYAHHPTEIRALLEAARERFPRRRTVVAFQPHQVSRTAAFLDDFARELARADELVLADIYAARDGSGAETSSAELADRIAVHGGRVEHIPTLERIADHLESSLRPGDLLLTAGAGDVHRVAGEVLERLAKR
ncbi:MAG: UDP-N-acetylmuramate--L-alanine ligase [Polyangia bacterium]